ncbi:MAG: transglutaminase domain-containing protein [Bacteroidota bacterium]
MKKISLISGFLILFNSVSFAQKPIELNYYLNGHGGYTFYSENHDFCNYIVIVSMSNMRNLKASSSFPFAAEVKPGKYTLFELSPISGENFPALKYAYTYFAGCSKPDVKLDFPYLLPIGAGKEAEAFNYEYVNSNPDDPEPKNWYGIGFKTASGDTVYAARRGTVVGMKDTTEFLSPGHDNSGEIGKVEIAHIDCSFGVYESLSGIFVRPGQRVETGEPIGIAADGPDSEGRSFRFSVHYNDLRIAPANDPEGKGVKQFWAYVPLSFWLDQNKITRLTPGMRYECLLNDSIITLEMEKSQIKKWKKDKAHPLPVTLIKPVNTSKGVVNEYAAIDKIALKLPDSLSKSTESIAGYITANFKTENDKARAIFIWIASNIQYDLENMFALNFYEKKEEKISKPLKTRKGICENYAALFTDICLKTGIKSFVIEGYTKQNGLADYIPHAWSAALIDSSWFTFDPTWGSGYVKSGKFYRKINNEYFKTVPSSLVTSHMPFDYLWQFLYYPITNQEFYEGKTKENKSKPYFNYVDSIQQYEKQNHTEQLLASASRIERNGIKNSMIFDRLQHIRMEIEQDKQSKSINLYNAAVSDFNDGISDYNDFIQYRNKKFIPKKPDQEIRNMLDSSAMKLKSSKTKLSEVVNPDENAVAMIHQLNKSVDEAFARVIEQQDWLKKYFSKGQSDRKMMFYEKIETLY